MEVAHPLWCRWTHTEVSVFRYGTVQCCTGLLQGERGACGRHTEREALLCRVHTGREHSECVWWVPRPRDCKWSKERWWETWWCTVCIWWWIGNSRACAALQM